MVMAVSTGWHLRIEMTSGCMQITGVCKHCCESGKVGVECKHAHVEDLLLTVK
jgi:hypothetical protein